MDLASAPVRPGFVLAWIVAVTGSAFLVMDWICPTGPIQAASASPTIIPGTLDAIDPLTPAGAVMPADPEQLRSISPVSDGDPLDFLQADPEDPEEVSGEAASTPMATAAIALPDRKDTRPFQALTLPATFQVLPAGVAFSPLALEWTYSSDEDEEPEVQLQVFRAGRGLYLLRLLLARYQELGFDALPDEFLSALPNEVLSKLKEGSHGGGGGTSNDPGTGGSWLNQARHAWQGLNGVPRQRLRQKGNDFLLLLSEEQLRQLRLKLLAVKRAQG